MGSDQSKSRTGTPQPQQVFQNNNNYGQRLNSSVRRTPPARPPPPSTANIQTQASNQTPNTTTKISNERQRNPYNFVREELPQPVDHKLYPNLTSRPSPTYQSSQQPRQRTTHENLTARYDNARAWIDNNYPCGPTNSFEVVENQFRVPSSTYRVQPTAPPAPASPTPQTSSGTQRLSTPKTSSPTQSSVTAQRSSTSQSSVITQRPSTSQSSVTTQRPSTSQSSVTAQRSSNPQTSSASQRRSAPQTSSASQRTSSPQASSAWRKSSATQRSSSPQRPSTPQRSSSPHRSPSSQRSSSSHRSSTPRGRPNKSQIRNNNNYKRNQNNNDILRCETCNSIHGQKIFQCDMNHNSCENCKHKQIICGKCSGGITNRRNFDVEKFMVANNYMMKCPNAANGCNLSFKSKEINVHVKECPYSDLKCPIPDGSCNWQGKISQLCDHFEEKHPSNKSDVDTEMVKNICSDSTSVHLIQLGAFKFLFYTKVSESDRKIYMAVQLIGTKMSAAKWSYEVHIYNKREPRRKFQYTDCCRSSAEALEGIMEGKCVVLPLNYAMTFIFEGNLTYKCFIKKEFDDRNNNRGRDRR